MEGLGQHIPKNSTGSVNLLLPVFYLCLRNSSLAPLLTITCAVAAAPTPNDFELTPDLLCNAVTNKLYTH